MTQVVPAESCDCSAAEKRAPRSLESRESEAVEIPNAQSADSELHTVLSVANPRAARRVLH